MMHRPSTTLEIYGDYDDTDYCTKCGSRNIEIVYVESTNQEWVVCLYCEFKELIE